MPAATKNAERLPSPPEAPSSLADVLDRILHRGVSLEGNLTIGVADVDLLCLDLRVLLASIDAIWPEGPSRLSITPSTTPSPLTEPPPPVTPLPSSPVSMSGPVPLADSVDTGEIAEPRRGPPASPTSHADGLVQLVLTLVKLLHEVLERQAVRRMSGGRLTPAQIESVGSALLAQTLEIERLRRHFGFAERDLTLKLDRHASEGTT
jgi:hypothetical protein